jgi:hypothetical protein
MASIIISRGEKQKQKQAPARLSSQMIRTLHKSGPPGLSAPAKSWPLWREAGAAWDCDWLSRVVASRQH